MEIHMAETLSSEMLSSEAETLLFQEVATLEAQSLEAVALMQHHGDG